VTCGVICDPTPTPDPARRVARPGNACDPHHQTEWYLRTRGETQTRAGAVSRADATLDLVVTGRRLPSTVGAYYNDSAAALMR
jgi:hypothetical protein